MKYFNDYISEGLIKKNSSLRNIKYKPKDKIELRTIIREKISKMNDDKINLLYLADIDVSDITDMDTLFSGYLASNIVKKIDISGWNTKNVQTMANMFAFCEYVDEIFGLDDLDISNVERMSSMFHDCSKLEKIDISKWDFRKVNSMVGMFRNCKKLKEIVGIENIKTDSLTYASGIFYNCWKLTKLDLNNWNTSNLYSVDHMFYGCKGLKEVRIGNFNMKDVPSIESLFENCQSLQDIDDLSNWYLPSLHNLAKAFKKCFNLVRIKGLDNWFKNGKYFQYKDLEDMFNQCINLKDIGDISHWDNIHNCRNTFKDTNIDNLPSWYYK